MTVPTVSSTVLTVESNGTSPLEARQITITGTSGALSSSVESTFSLQDFTFSMTPTELALPSGGEVSATVTVGALNAFASVVTFAASGLPSDVHATFVPSTVSGSGAATLTLRADSNATTRLVAATITASSGSLSHGQALTLGVGPSTPAITSVTPNSGTVSAQVFQVVATGGTIAPTEVRLYITTGSETATPGSCSMRYRNGAIELMKDDGVTWLTPAAVGTATYPTNEQCAVRADSATAAVSGNTLTLSFAVAFTPGFNGARNLHAWTSNGTTTSGWLQKGAVTVAQQIGIASVSPESGSGPQQFLTITATDSIGATDISRIWVQIDSSVPVSAGTRCFLYYDRPANLIYLLQDGGTTYVPVAPGSGASSSNSRCSVRGNESSVTSSGNSLSLRLDLSFSSAAAGLQTTYVYVNNAQTNTGWRAEASWNSTMNVAPSALSVSPQGQTGLARTFTFQFSDENGAGDMGSAQILFSPGPTTSACWIYYHQPTNGLWLANDTGQWITPPLVVGQTGSQQNSQCTLDAGASTVTKTGTSLTLALALTFKPAFAGANPTNIYMGADDLSGLSTGMPLRGTWTVAPSMPAVDSVQYSNPSGWSQLFTFNFTDADGASSISVAEVQIGAGATAVNACYLWYDRAANVLSLRDDADTGWSGIAPGTAGSVENSQCKIDGLSSTVSATGTLLRLHVMIVFKPAFAGVKNIHMAAAAIGGVSSGRQFMGTWTVVERPDFELLVTPTSQTIAPGNQATYTVSARSLYAFAGDVNLSLAPSDLPPGASVGALSDSVLTVTATGSETAAVTVNAGTSGSNTPATLRVTGTSGSLTHSASAKLWVGVSGAPSVESVSPFQGTGPAATFTVTVSEPAGLGNLSNTYLRISSQLTGAPACEILYRPDMNSLVLVDEVNGLPDWSRDLGVPPWSSTKSTNQCSLHGPMSWKAVAGNTLMLGLRVSFNPSFVGAKKLFMSARNQSGYESGWVERGTWTVTADADFDMTITPNQLTRTPGSPAEFSVSVTPRNGFSGQVQLLLPDLPSSEWIRTFNPAAVTPTPPNAASSWLSLYVPTTFQGIKPVRVTAAGTNKSVQAELYIQCASPDFSALPAQSEQSAPAGSSLSYIITFRGCANYAGSLLSKTGQTGNAVC